LKQAGYYYPVTNEPPMKKRFLLYLIPAFFLAGCKESFDDSMNQSKPLYSKPITVALDLKEGYKINQLTGDSIKPVINSVGDTVKTGAAAPFIAKKIDKKFFFKSKIIKSVQVIKTIIPDNVHSIQGKLSTITVDTSRLKKVKLGEGDQSLVLRNKYGIVQTGVPIPVIGKKMPFSEPHPVKASPMRFKDNATTNIQYLDVDQGLNYSYVLDVCEDKKGNLWFGMDGAGINKYDGINITNYTVKEGLSNNDVHSLFEDRNNNLWLGTQGGVTCFDGKNFIQYTEKEGLLNNGIISISEDRKGNLWFCTLGGLTKYNGKDFTHYTRKEGLPCDTVYQCIEDKNGNIWLGTYHGAAKFDGNFFTHYTQKDGLAGESIFSLVEDKDGNLWFGTGNGINKFDGKSFTHFTKDNGLSSNLTVSLSCDRSGNIWIGTTGGGLNKFDRKYFTQYDLEQGLSNNKLRKITEDKNGNIWFGTDGGGVNRLNKMSFDYPIPGNVMDNNRIRPILKDKNGNLWLGTDDGHVGKLAAEQNLDGGRLFTYYKVQDKLYAKGQRSLLQDKMGNIWIGTTGSGIIKYDGKSFTNYSLGTIPEGQSIFDILEDKKGNLWFGIRDGSIVRYDGKEFAFYETDQKLPGSIIYSMLEDKKGNIWFCTEGAGIYKYDGTNLIIYSEKEGLFSNRVTSIAEDDKGNLWLGTLGAGLCKFDGREFTYFTEQQGLAYKNVWSVYCDSAKHIWVGTDKGLSLCELRKNGQMNSSNNYIFYNFDAQDGLKAIDFNLHSVCIDNNNHIMWGTGKNVPFFDLNKKFDLDTVRTPGLNYIDINERFCDFRNLPDSDGRKISFSSIPSFRNFPNDLILPYDQNHLTFYFSAIDWSAPDKIQYSYRLIGSDINWSSPSHISYADYRNLQHGNYELQVKAIGRSQIWTKFSSYHFTILPAWWQTLWFKTAIVIFALLVSIYISWLIYLYRLRKQRMLLEKQIAIQNERQRISSEMHDDIGAGLSSVRLLTEMTKNKLKNTTATNDIDNIYESVGDISTKMQEVIWSLNAENDHLNNLIYFIQKQVRSMLEHYPGKLSFELPAVIPDIELSGEIRRNIYLVVKEAVHNIIKHSGADKVKLAITLEEKLVITVSDNGKGMNAESHNTGNGWKNMQQRIKKLDGVFLTKNEEGLTLIFEIPIKPAL